VSARLLEDCACASINVGINDYDAWIVVARNDEMIGGEQDAAKNDEMQQWLAQPSRDGCAAVRC
jgi:hypothetical protein